MTRSGCRLCYSDELEIDCLDMNEVFTELSNDNFKLHS